MEQRSRPNASPSFRAITCRMSMKWRELCTSRRISITARRCLRSRSSSATRAASRSPSAWVRAVEMVMAYNERATHAASSGCRPPPGTVASTPMRTLTLLLVAATGVLSAQARPASPLAPWPVVSELPGMGRAIDTSVTGARRRALARRLGRGVVVVPAAHGRDLELDYIQDNDFRQHNTFFYLTQLEAKDAWLLMTVPDSGPVETVLFLPARNPMRERWTGIALGPDSVAARLTGIATVLPTDSLERRLQRV